MILIENTEFYFRFHIAIDVETVMALYEIVFDLAPAGTEYFTLCSPYVSTITGLMEQ